MTIEQPTFLDREHVSHELAQARRDVEQYLDAIREFSTVVSTRPWIYLDHLLNDLRAAATTVATLEGLVDRFPE